MELCDAAPSPAAAEAEFCEVTLALALCGFAAEFSAVAEGAVGEAAPLGCELVVGSNPDGVGGGCDGDELIGCVVCGKFEDDDAGAAAGAEPLSVFAEEAEGWAVCDGDELVPVEDEVEASDVAAVELAELLPAELDSGVAEDGVLGCVGADGAELEADSVEFEAEDDSDGAELEPA